MKIAQDFIKQYGEKTFGDTNWSGWLKGPGVEIRNSINGKVLMIGLFNDGNIKEGIRIFDDGYVDEGEHG